MVEVAGAVNGLSREMVEEMSWEDGKADCMSDKVKLPMFSIDQGSL